MADVFGYKRDLTERPEPDGSTSDWIARDLDAKTFLAKTAIVTADGDVDLRPYCTDTNQWQLSACAGNATADSVEIVNAIEEEKAAKAESRAPQPVDQLSRLFVYSMARTLMGELNKDEGTYIRACFEVLSRFGIPREDAWPYLDEKVFISPSLKSQREAVGHKIHSYYRIKEVGQDRLGAVEGALRVKHPVVFGTLIEQSFRALKGPGPVGPPKGATIGGHAMIIVGLIGGNFLVKNSWGPGWGDNGFWLMTPEYLAWENTWDLWVPTLGTSFG